MKMFWEKYHAIKLPCSFKILWDFYFVTCDFWRFEGMKFGVLND